MSRGGDRGGGKCVWEQTIVPISFFKAPTSLKLYRRRGSTKYIYLETNQGSELGTVHRLDLLCTRTHTRKQSS